jgi:DNA-binding transcriptional MerR regulator
MNGTSYQIAIYRAEYQRLSMEDRERFTLEDVATRAGLHPALIEQFLEYGLIEATERRGAQTLFDISCVLRAQKIERLRHDLGANLASVAVILDLLDRMGSLQNEVERLRGIAP